MRRWEICLPPRITQTFTFYLSFKPKSPCNICASTQCAWNTGDKRCAKMVTQVYKTVTGHEVTNIMLEEAAKLFSGNYGIWGMCSDESTRRSRVSSCDAGQTPSIQVEIWPTKRGTCQTPTPLEPLFCRLYLKTHHRSDTYRFPEFKTDDVPSEQHPSPSRSSQLLSNSPGA